MIALTLVLGGGVGNLIDRVGMGSVTDFLYVELGPFHTGIFNLADMAIVAGVLLISVSSFSRRSHRPRFQ